MSRMNEREKKIIEAAVEVFHRYGVKRASMSDIADEAGVSRQTVYNAFSNKDELGGRYIDTSRNAPEQFKVRMQPPLHHTAPVVGFTP